LGLSLFVRAELPPGWSTQHWGNGEKIAAGATGGTWTVTCDGSDLWGTSDQGGMAYRAINGDFDISCRMVSIAGRTTDAWTRGGIMARNSLAADSRNALVYWKPVQGSSSRVDFNRRETDGGNTVRDEGMGIDYPTWMRLRRTGDAFAAFMSWDGQSWMPFRSARTIEMDDTIYCGFAVASRDANQTSTFTFDNVGGLPINNDIGATNVMMREATFQGELVETAGPTYVRIYWGTTDGGVTAGAWSNVESFVTAQSVGMLGTNITGLTPDTVYYYRCHASNANWQTWAPLTASFRTQSIFTWDGDTDDMWGTPENWSSTNVPETVGEFAKFEGLGEGDVDLGGGNYTIDSALVVAGDYVLTNSGASALLNVTGTTAVTGGSLTFDNVAEFRTDALVLGGGTVTVDDAIMIVSPREGALLHRGYHVANNDNYMSLDGNGGLMALEPEGTSVLIDGPDGRGLDFDHDADFTRTGAVSRRDSFANLFIGYFNAPETGRYWFRVTQDDDRCGIWLDLDQDNVFESSVAGLGQNRGEQLAWEDYNIHRVELTGGSRYLFAVTHREGGGLSGIDVRFKMPSMVEEAVINPGDPAQAGLWSVWEGDVDASHLSPIVVTNDSELAAAGLPLQQDGTVKGAVFGDVVLSNGTLTVSGQPGAPLHFNGMTGTGNVSLSDNVLLLDTASTMGMLIAGDGAMTGAAITVDELYDLEPQLTVHNALGGDVELHAGADDSADGMIALLGANTYTGATRITRAQLRADDGVGLPTGSRLVFSQNTRDQTCILESKGTFERDIGQEAGEVFWEDVGGGGGFAARGGDLTVELEGGAELAWDSADAGFNKVDSLQFSSRTADSMVEFKNNIVLDSSSYRSIQVIDNPDTKADVVRLSGDIGGGSADASKRFSFNESWGNQFDPADRYWSPLVELTGNNSYLTATAIRLCTLAADDGVGLPTDSCLRFWGHNDWRPAVLLTSGAFTRNIGTGAGEVHWSGRGGFAARGGDLAVNLEGGATLDWSDGNGGFNGQVLQLGSQHADSVVEIRNNIMIDSTNVRYINLFDNLDTKADYAVISGNLLTQDNPDRWLWIRGNGLVWLTGTNSTYEQGTIFDEGVTLRVSDQSIISTNTTIAFDGNNLDMPCILECKGMLTLNVGPQNEDGAVSWDRVHGGFAAYGGPLTVNLENDVTLTPGGTDTGFDAHALELGSHTANDMVDFQNDIFLDRTQRIQVYDNPDSENDRTVYSGDITYSGAAELDIGGHGTLEMTGAVGARAMRIYQTVTVHLNGSCELGNEMYTQVDQSGRVGGTGTVSVINRMDIRQLGRLSPGCWGVGMLDVSTGMHWDDGLRMYDESTYEWELGSANNDLVAVTGRLELRSGWRLKLMGAGGTPRADEQYDLFTCEGDVVFNPPELDTSEMPADWDVSGARVVHDYEDGRVYLTGVSSTLAVANREATDLASTSAMLNGTLSCSGLAMNVWVYWGTSDGGTNAGAWSNGVQVASYTGVVDQALSHTVSGLDTNVQYYYAFRATNATLDMWGVPSQGFTALGPPVVDNDGATDITPLATARLRGSFVDHNRGEVTICWGLSDGGTNSPADWENHAVLGEQTVAAFAHVASGLLYPLTYYYRCYATNACGEDWSDTAATFVMDQPPMGVEGAAQGLKVRTYDTLAGTANLDPIANLFDATESGRTTQTVAIAHTSFTSFPGITSDDTLSILWHGVFLADESTDYVFATDSDDGAVIYLDLNRDGDYADSGELVLDANWAQGVGVPEIDTIYLSAGVYEIAIGFYEQGGNQGMTARWGKGTTANWGTMNPIDGLSERFFVEIGSSIKVINEQPTDRTLTGATLNGVVDMTNSVFDLWVYWGDADGGTNAGQWETNAFLGTYTNKYDMDVSHTIGGLAPLSTPFYTFRLSNAVDSAWGVPSTNVPAVAAPIVENSGIVTADVGVVMLQGTFTTGIVGDVTIYWGRSDGGTNAAAWDSAVVFEDRLQGAFSADVATGSGFTYYYRCYVTNAAGRDWADATTDFTIEAPPQIEYTFDAVRYAYFGGAAQDQLSAIDDGAANGQNGGLFAIAPSPEANWPNPVKGKAVWTTEVQGPGNMADNYCQMWWGHFHPPETGTYTFYLRGDDYEIFWVDRNRNDGEFEAGSDDFVRNYPPEGWNTWHDNENITLTNGEAYAFALACREGGGGDWVDFKITVPGDTQREVNPGDPNQAGWWSMPEVTYYTPAISNTTESALTADAATLNGMIVGGTGITYDVWVHWGATDGGTNATNWTHHAFAGAYTNHDGAVSCTVTGLTAQTAYFYTFQATNTLGEMWAAPSEPFETLGGTLAVTNIPAFDIGQTQATLGGELVAGGGAEATIYWGMSDGGQNHTAWANTSHVGEVSLESFSESVSLPAGATCHYRCYVTNAVDDAWAPSTAVFTSAVPAVSLSMAIVRGDLGIDPLSIDGCELWLAADDIDGDGETTDNPTNGAPVDIWYDKSGHAEQSRDATRHGYEQTAYNVNGPNGRPVVTFDGDYLSTSHNFDDLTEYTVLSAARYTGGDNERVIASSTRNWLFGFHGNADERWHAEGWIHMAGAADTNWHVHAGHIDSAADPEADFWKDGTKLATDSTGSGNANYMIGRLALGGYRVDSEESKCEIAEVLIYNRVLTAEELDRLGLYLSWKYGLKTGYTESGPTVVTETRGGFEVTASLSSESVSNVTVNFDFGTNAMGYVEGMRGSIFRDRILNDNAINLDSAGYSVSDRRVVTGDKTGTILVLDEDPDFNVIATGTIQNWNQFPGFNSGIDYFATVFSGTIVPRVSGSHEFRGQSDDTSRMYIDMAGDGVWDNGDRVFAGNTSGTETLTQGQPYNFVYMQREGTGNQSINWYVTEPGGEEERVGTDLQPGMWNYGVPMATVSNDYTVSAVSATIPAGSLSTNISLTIVDDLDQEDDEAVTVGIASLVNATNGHPDVVSGVLNSHDPKVTTGAGATNMTGSSATLTGMLTMGDDADVTLYRGDIDGGMNHANWGATVVVGNVTEDFAFSTDISGLWAGKAYYYRCYATNDSNLAQDWSDALCFTTTAAAVSIDDIAVVEGDAGDTNAVFTISVSATGLASVAVSYSTSNGTALAGADYTAVTGRVVIAPGVLSTQVSVQVTGDTLYEFPDEAFTVILSDPTNGVIDAGTGTCTIVDDDVSGYIADFPSRMKITISGYTGTTTLVNFPVLVRLSENIDRFEYATFASDTGGDLRFTDGDVKRLLSHEIEEWDTTDESCVWVKLPELPPGGTFVWARWGNANEKTAPSYTTDGSTWSEGYDAVWHFASTNGTTAHESTANPYDGTLHNMEDGDWGASPVGNALHFNAENQNNEFVDVPDGFADYTDGITVEAWAKYDNFESYSRIMDFGRGQDVDNILLANQGTSATCILDVKDPDDSLARGNVWELGNWVYVAALMDASAVATMYKNGVQQGATQADWGPPPVITRTINYIGRSNWGNDRYLRATIDELRISRVARSADWIGAAHDNCVEDSKFLEYSDTFSPTGMVLIIR